MSDMPIALPTLFRDNALSVGLMLPIREAEGHDVDFLEQVGLASDTCHPFCLLGPTETP